METLAFITTHKFFILKIFYLETMESILGWRLSGESHLEVTKHAISPTYPNF